MPRTSPRLTWKLTSLKAQKSPSASSSRPGAAAGEALGHGGHEVAEAVAKLAAVELLPDVVDSGGDVGHGRMRDKG